MFKQKALHNPLRPVAPKLSSVKVNPVFYQNSTQLVFQDNNQTTDPLSLSKDGSDSAGSNGSSSDFETEMRNYKDSFMDPRYAAFKRNVTAMMSAQNQNKTTKSTSAQTLKQAPVFLKPLEAQRLKNSLLLADGGEEGYASGDVRYDPKTGKIVPRVKLETALPGVTGENSDAVDILADMPEDFNFTGWDNKTARQQQQELQKAGVTPKDQMVLLNSATSLETLALIQDISNNRRDYGLSVLDVERISKELLQISNARVGAKNHDIPLGVNPTTRNTFLAMLDEKQQSLLASFGFGVAGIKDSKNPNVDIGNKITDLLQGDHSISDLLHGNSDAYQVADQFFGDMAKLDTMISNITDGTITFDNPKDKQRYLDYLTRAYEKNDNLYRNMLASEIEEAGLLQFPEWRLKQLVNDLSLTQLEGLVAQIEANG
ncbi:MAG: hypothetical protein C0413_02460, partial [Clostridiales bacterium]|nr:hypothetical protein [Clostridiales bacterium]